MFGPDQQVRSGGEELVDVCSLVPGQEPEEPSAIAQLEEAPGQRLVGWPNGDPCGAVLSEHAVVQRAVEVNHDRADPALQHGGQPTKAQLTGRLQAGGAAKYESRDRVGSSGQVPPPLMARH